MPDAKPWRIECPGAPALDRQSASRTSALSIARRMSRVHQRNFVVYQSGVATPIAIYTFNP